MCQIYAPLPVPVETHDLWHCASPHLVSYGPEFCTMHRDSILKSGNLSVAPILVGIPGLRLLPLHNASTREREEAHRERRTFSRRVGDFIVTVSKSRPFSHASVKRLVTSVSQSTPDLTFSLPGNARLYVSTAGSWSVSVLLWEMPCALTCFH